MDLNRVNKKKRTVSVPFPWLSVAVLGLVVLGCVFHKQLMRIDPSYIDLYHAYSPPGRVYWFGTDSMGRDLFSMIWQGGLISLAIGVSSALISGAAGILLGVLAGLAPKRLDGLLLKFMEVFLSIPTLLLVVLVQSLFSSASVLSLCLVIGLTSWPSLALMVRMQVRQLRLELFYKSACAMGADGWHLFRYHLLPHLAPSAIYMTIMEVRRAIIYESTLSFMGLGIPIEVLSWGSMLSMADQAFLSNAWWIMIVPGLFLVGIMVCLTQIGEYIRFCLS